MIKVGDRVYIWNRMDMTGEVGELKQTKVKTWFVGNELFGNWQVGPLAWHYGTHGGGSSFVFADGHAQIDNVQPFNDYWLATGGAKHRPLLGADTNGLLAYTYPPELNTETLVASAEWWVPPHYPAAPLIDLQYGPPGWVR